MAPHSRNSISLNIAGRSDEHYDQICALSQKVINENFEILFKQREEEFSSIRYWDDQNNAKLVCDLAPPTLQLMMGASEEPEYYFELRIKTGSIGFKDGRTQDLAGFVVAVRAMLAMQDISPSRKLDADAAAEIAPYFAEVKKSYDTSKVEAGLKAGDYSVERLFTNILESNWLSPDKKLSKLPDPNDPKRIITFKEWEEDKSSRAQLKSSAVGKVLGNWAMENSHSGLWTLGLQVKLPDTTAETNIATYLPIGVRRQNYPFLNSDEDWDGVKAKGLETLYGRDYNCLLFCEVVQSDIRAENPKLRTLPAGRSLAFTGNLADASTPGTYVLDHRTYFFNRILKDLRQLCVAINVIPLKPDMGVDPASKEHYFRSGLAVGANPPDRKNLYPTVANQDPADPAFDFQYIDAGEYKWSKMQAAPGSLSETKCFTGCVFAPIWRKWDMNSTQSVTVKWTPGGNKITVTGDIKYRHWEAYSTKHENWGWNGRGNDPFYFGRISIDVTWSFNIIFKPTNTGLVPEITGIENGLPTNFRVKPDMEYVLDNTLTRLTQDVQKNLTKSLASITTNLREGFKNTGKLTYPGTRTLQFGLPQISNCGDIITTITYKPLGKDLITLEKPKPGDLTEPPVFDDPKPPQDSLVFTPKGNLNWDISFKSYDPKSSRATLVLRGSAGPVPFALDLAHIELLGNSGKDGTSLFTDRDRWETPAEVETRTEKAEQEWQEKLEAERKRQIAVAKKEFEASKTERVGELQTKIDGIDDDCKQRTAKLDKAERAYGVEMARLSAAKQPRDAAKKLENAKTLEEARKLKENAAEGPRQDPEKDFPEEAAESGEKKVQEESVAPGEKDIPKESAALGEEKIPEEPAVLVDTNIREEPTAPGVTNISDEPATSVETDKLPPQEHGGEHVDIAAKPSGVEMVSNGQEKDAKPEESVKPTDPAFTAAEQGMQAAQALVDDTKKALREAKAKLEQLSKETFDETTVIFNPPERPKQPTPEEENLQIYGMKTSNIMETLELAIQPDGSSLFFKIKQKPKGVLVKKSYRWIMHPESYIEITIEGTVGRPGNYAAQIQETWNSMDPAVDFKKSKFSDVFWKFMLLSGGSALAESTSQTEANVIRGLVPPAAAKPTN